MANKRVHPRVRVKCGQWELGGRLPCRPETDVERARGRAFAVRLDTNQEQICSKNGDAKQTYFAVAAARWAIASV